MSRVIDRHAVVPTIICSLTAFVVLGSTVSAQLPAAPTLQNAFANGGLVIAGDFAGGGGHSFYGAAAALGLASGRIQLSGAAGADRGNGSTRGAYGVRAAVNVWQSGSGSLGAGAFAGFGGAPRTTLNNVVNNPATVIVPAGISLGYRRPMGTTRGLSVYASPFYKWVRADNGTVTSKGSLRGAAGLDIAFSQSLGITLGGEFGQGNGAGGSSTMAVAISFVPGRGGY